MNKKILTSIGLLYLASHVQTYAFTTTQQLATSIQLTNILSKKELIEQLRNNIDSLLIEKRTHPLTMAIIHFLNLGHNSKPQQKPSSNSPAQSQRIPIDEEYVFENEHIKNAIKEIFLAILAQQSDELDSAINELLEQLKIS
jgi:hypothetical protein